MSRLNPGGVRMANLESSSSRLMSTISEMASDMVPLFRAAGTGRAAPTASCFRRERLFPARLTGARVDLGAQRDDQSIRLALVLELARENDPGRADEVVDRVRQRRVRVACQRRIHDRLMLGIEVAPRETVLNRETAIAVAQIVELDAKRHHLRRTARADQRVMEGAVLAVPFLAQALSFGLATALEAVRRRQDLRLPAAIPRRDRRAQRDALDPGTRFREVEQVLDRYRRYPEAALPFGRDQVERAELGQRLA